MTADIHPHFLFGQLYDRRVYLHRLACRPNLWNINQIWIYNKDYTIHIGLYSVPELPWNTSRGVAVLRNIFLTFFVSFLMLLLSRRT